MSVAAIRQLACGPQWLDVAPGAQASVDSSPTVAGGLVYAGHNTGEVLAWPAGPCGTFQCASVFRGATGDPVVSSSPTVVNGRIYIGGADIFAQGRLFVFSRGQVARVILGGTPGHRTVKVPAWHGIDPEG